MADSATTDVLNRPAWVDLATTDPAAAREFYGRLFGWNIEVNPDPQYGGYAIARVGGEDVAGLGPTQSPDQPSAWSLYIGTDDVTRMGMRVEGAGGTVVVPSMAVGDQGTMAVFQDPAGAFISAWQPNKMAGFRTGGANAFGWAELEARGFDQDVGFYRDVFGWTPKTTDTGGQPYTEFQVDGESVLGGQEMSPMMPGNVPSFWLTYFMADDVDRAFGQARELGANELVAPRDFPGGRFAILMDPQNAAFGLLQMAPAG